MPSKNAGIGADTDIQISELVHSTYQGINTHLNEILARQLEKKIHEF